MRPSRFNERDIREAIAQVQAGTPLVAMCRKLGVTPTTFYRWRTKYGEAEGAPLDEARVLRSENQKLKQLVADLSLERQSLRESLGKRAKKPRKERG